MVRTKNGQTQDRNLAISQSRNILTEMAIHFEPGPGGPVTTEVAIFAMILGFAKLIEIGRVVPGSGDARDVKFEDVFAFLNLKEK